ncbi:hypothetical protein C8E89_106236 [Mycolicibacterium moriokaense]|uniref:Uncharacterized protein n=1 Tax=Mycolicibacterium moriokaense TaxID=39691 RepID=A0A318HI79_9MYCO|nr:hypothetical protein C8E89_106236 [Mycolicibacterium moriokaense]
MSKTVNAPPFELLGLGMRLRSDFGDLGLRGRARVPNRGTPEPAIVHGFARRFLVFKLSDQLALRISKSTGYIRVLSDRYQLRKAGQSRAQRDPLLITTAVLQGDIDIHIVRIPPPQMRLERRQRIQHERTLLRYETRAHADNVLTKGDSLFVVRLAHRGLVSSALLGRIHGGRAHLSSWSSSDPRANSGQAY